MCSFAVSGPAANFVRYSRGAESPSSSWSSRGAVSSRYDLSTGFYPHRYSASGSATGDLAFVHFGITAAARRYLEPLVRGEAYPPYGRNGIPAYVGLENPRVEKKLAAWDG